jgi:hypothetical protein
MTVIVPQIPKAQKDSWLALLEVAEQMPAGWCLVGGQLVHLHCWERGFSPSRPTNDADAVLDVRGYPDILRKFTTKLVDLGFTSAGANANSHEHRWMRGDAVIDILIPSGVGQRASKRTGVTGSTTLATPAAQQALDRSELTEISIGGRVGSIPRPNLLGSLVAKAGAYGVPLDAERLRHATDFTVLAAMVTRRDAIAGHLTKRDREHLRPLLADLPNIRSEWAGIEGAERGVDLLGTMVGSTAQR